MAAAKIVSFFSLVILLLAVAATAIPIPSGDARLSFPSTGDAAEEATADCWKVLLQSESCAVDLLRWLSSPRPNHPTVRVRPVCCGILVRIGETCINALFPSPLVRELYAPLVQRTCGIPLGVSHGVRQ